MSISSSSVAQTEPLADATPLLELAAIYQEFPGQNTHEPHKKVLENINFTVERPETICLLGPSGCGKSTVLRLISGMYDRYIKMPTAGNVKINGQPVSGPHDDVLTVFQRPVLKAWLNIRNNILLPFKAGLWGKNIAPAERLKRVDDILQEVGLADAANLYPRQLSGGMQQRVSLAARLVLRPTILCLDEPFSALDPQTRKEMQELVLNLWKKFSCLALFVTHDVTEALRIADRIIVLSTRPGTVVIDLTISAPKPRSDEWLRTAEARDLEQQIINRIREAATAASRGTIKMDV